MRAPLPASAPPRLAPLWVLLPLALASGCGRTMTEEDCRKVGESLQAAWAAEAKRATPAQPDGADQAAGVVKSEQEKLVTEWAAECKKDLVGRRVEAAEMDCLLAAKTLDQINKCATP